MTKTDALKAPVIVIFSNETKIHLNQDHGAI